MKASFLVGVSVLLLGLRLVLADADDYSCGVAGMMSGGYGFSGIFFGWVIGFLVIVVLVLLIVWLVRRIQNK